MGRDDALAFQLQADGRIDRGDVLVLAAGDLLEMEAPAVVTDRDAHPGRHLARPQRQLLVAQEEFAQFHGAHLGAKAQADDGVAGQEDDAQVADGRGIDDIAADGGAVAHLGGGDAAQGVAEPGQGGGEQRRLHHVGDGGGGADEDALGIGPDGGEARAARKELQFLLRQLGTALHVEVGAAGHDHGGGFFCRGCGTPSPGTFNSGRGQRLQARRDGGEIAGEDAELDQCRQAVGSGEQLGPQLAQQALQRPADRRVAGAAADVALDGGDGSVVQQPRVVEQEAAEADHQARSAEAALAGPLADDGLLHRGQVGVVQPLDGDHVAAGGIAQGKKAGDHGAVAHAARGGRAQQHGAGATVALATADARAGQALVVADKIDQGGPRRQGGAHLPVVEDEDDLFGHR